MNSVQKAKNSLHSLLYPINQGPVVRSMVSPNHWLSSIKTNWLSWYLTLVGANQASSNSAQPSKEKMFQLFHFFTVIPMYTWTLNHLNKLKMAQVITKHF